MKKVLFVALAVVIVLAGTVMSCGKGGDGNGGTSTATNTQSQQSQNNNNSNGILPGGDDSWEFNDIPKYPGADEAYKLRGEEPGEPPVILEHVIYITNDSPQEAGDFYRLEMADEGWEEAFWGDMAGGFIGSFTKPGDVGAAIGIAPTSEGQTMITIDKRYPKS